jgi:hypothetical protein
MTTKLPRTLVRGERGISEDLDENNDPIDDLEGWMPMGRVSFVFEHVSRARRYLSSPEFKFLAKMIGATKT